MKNLVQSIALAAAVAAVAVGVWRDYTATVVLRQAAVAYLGAYFVAGAAWILCQAALRGVRDPEPPPEPPADPRKRNRQRRQTPATTPNSQSSPAAAADAAAQPVDVS